MTGDGNERTAGTSRGPTGRRLRRAGAIVRLGVRWLLGKLAGRESTRLLVSVTGIAVAIMVLITVSGVALGVASQTAVQGDDVDYWVVPDDGDLETIAVSTAGPKLGNVHETARRVGADDRVEYATPVLLQIVPIDAGGERRYVLFVGVVVPEQRPTIAGLPTASLSPGDPHYAGGDYDGTWTGEAVVNSAAADVLGVSTGETIDPPGTDRPLSVETVTDGALTTGAGTVPVALVHLGELQSMTGMTDGDTADQILVSTNAAGVRERLEGVYPNTAVVTRTGLTAPDVSTSSLPLAMGGAALVTSLLVGVLFTATMMGLEVAADRPTLGTLTALGYSARSLTGLVVTETVCLAVVGGVAGVGLGRVGVAAVNLLATEAFGVRSLATFPPALVGYGLAVAVVIGLLAAPYPIWLSRRTDPLAVIRR